MIIKALPSAESVYSPLYYNINKVESGDAVIIAVQNIDSPNWKCILRTLLERQAIARKTKKRAIHIVLSPAIKEKLTDNQAIRLISQILNNVGLGKQPYIIVKHEDTKHIHYHVVSTKIKDNGKSVIWNGIGKRLTFELMKYEKEYEYTAGRNMQTVTSVNGEGLVSEATAKFIEVLENAKVKSRNGCSQLLLHEGYKMKIIGKGEKETIMLKSIGATHRPIFLKKKYLKRLDKVIAQNNQKVIWESTAGLSETRILQDGNKQRLQKRSIRHEMVSGRPCQKYVWEDILCFTSHEEIYKDKDYHYLRILTNRGIELINQYGITLNEKRRKRLGVLGVSTTTKINHFGKKVTRR